MSRTNAAAAKTAPSTPDAKTAQAKGEDTAPNPFDQAAADTAKPAGDANPPKTDTAKPAEGKAEEQPAPKVERTPLGKPSTYLPTVSDCLCEAPNAIGGVFRNLPNAPDMTDKEIAEELKFLGDPNQNVSKARGEYEAAQLKLKSETERLRDEVIKHEHRMRELMAYLPGASKRVAALKEVVEQRKAAKPS